MSNPLKILEEMKNNAILQNQQLKSDKKFCVLVGSATCENAAGSTEIFKKLKDELKNKKDICVNITGCTGRCSKEPLVRIIDNKERKDYVYSEVTLEKLDKIINNHIKNNQVVKEYLLDS